MSIKASYDVVIIGGGPAGTTCATLLAREGRSVVVLEKEIFPRFHIGESITSFGFEAFRRLGVHEELESMNQVKKRGLEFIHPDKEPQQIRFLPDRETGEHPYAFQMPRAKLDHVLMKNARKNGAEIYENVLAKKVLFDGDRAIGVRYKSFNDDDHSEKTVYGKWIVDASGQAGILNRQLEDNWYDDPLLEKKMAVYSHWRGDIGIKNTEDELNFKLCVHRNRRDWAWYIPVGADTVSLGLVLSQKTLKEEVRERSLDEIFYDYATELPFIGDLLKNPTLERVEKFRCTKDYSYRSKRYYGDHWAIVGDSAGFIDPVFSTGLQVTFNSAFSLAPTLHQLLEQEDPDLSVLQDYEKTLDRIFRVNSILVYLFYLSDLDRVQFQSGWTLWNRIEWAGWRYRLSYILEGLRFMMASEDKKRDWSTQVLFGDPSPGNPVANFYMALSENYDKINAQRSGRSSVAVVTEEA